MFLATRYSVPLITASVAFTSKSELGKVTPKWVAVIFRKLIDFSESNCVSQGRLSNAAVTNSPSSVA